jgi:hypothetical protein
MGYFDETEPSFAQRFGDWDSVSQPPVDALGRWRVFDAEGRPMSDFYKKLARPFSQVITEETLAMKEMEARLRDAARERAQAGLGFDPPYADKAVGGRQADTPASFAQRFGDWERLPQQGADTSYRPRVTDAAGRPMSDFYEAFARPARLTEGARAVETEEPARKAAAERARASWEVDVPDIAKSSGTGVAKGVIGLAGLGGDAWSLIDSGLAKAGLTEGQRGLAKRAIVNSGLLGPVLSPFLSGPTSKGIQSKAEEYTGEFYKPKTRVGRYTETAGEFVPGAALPGGWLRNLVKFALLPGIASEAAGEATSGTKWEPYARGGAALATGLGAAALTRPRPRGAQWGSPSDASSSMAKGDRRVKARCPKREASPAITWNSMIFPMCRKRRSQPYTRSIGFHMGLLGMRTGALLTRLRE